MAAGEHSAPEARKAPDERTFFVDEAGDPVFFGKRGKVLVGTDGCSRYFMLGMAQIENHSEAFQKLENLRRELLADPYFKDVPSMQLAEEKTALCFHAKNDLPEVRREVFKVLQTIKVRVRVVVRDKQAILTTLRSMGLRFRIDEKWPVRQLGHGIVPRPAPCRGFKQNHVCSARQDGQNRGAVGCHN